MNRLLASSAGLHAASLATILVAPRLWRPALAAVALNQAVLSGAGLWPRSRLLGPNLTRVPADTPGIVLSFDDGPDPEVTPRVLDLLDEAGAHASFFCIGQRARAFPGLVRDIARRGHTVENHTDRHPRHFAALGLAGIRREIRQAQAVLTELAGRPPRWFRAPMGLRNPLLQTVLDETGLTLASWTRRALDGARTCRPEDALCRLATGLAAGDVLLMHDGNCARDEDGTAAVLDILPPLLERMRTLGLAGLSLGMALPGLPATGSTVAAAAAPADAAAGRSGRDAGASR